jgi:hypothetical protein
MQPSHDSWRKRSSYGEGAICKEGRAWICSDVTAALACDIYQDQECIDRLLEMGDLAIAPCTPLPA